MRFRFQDLWHWDGTVGRGPYALIGVLGFAIKHNLDRFVASGLFHRRWDLFNYWVPPTKAIHITDLPRQDAELLATLLVLSLPFIWIGVTMTLKRLRAAGLPSWLVVLFFAPVLNLAFFTVLSLLPSKPTGGLKELANERPQGAFFRRVIPESAMGSAALAAFVTVVLGSLAAALGTEVLTRYGWGLFVALPFCLGLFSVLIYGYHGPRNFWSCMGVSLFSVALLGFALLALAIEGAICLAMAAPIGVVLAMIGGALGYFIQRRPSGKEGLPATALGVILFAPLLMGAEAVAPPVAPLLEVRTPIEINAPPEIVWKHVVEFAELPPPSDPLFRLGIAYPTRAVIEGSGAGAVRRCKFSTGDFVEPIQVWQEPRLLRFSVASQPAPMQEWTPYREIHPPHLSGFLVSEQGQFLLTAQSPSRTRLEGTTWYRHNMWPAAYWQVWSDFIIHRIHLRVLQHIKRLAEEDYAQSTRTP
jgi:hypothetical protein